MIDQQAEERHAALMAVSHGLAMADQLTLIRNARRMWDRLQGAQVSDILELTIDHDLFLNETEAFFSACGGELPESGNYAALVAAHALLILERPLTTAAVIALLVRAGVVDEAPGYDPVHDLAVIIMEAYAGDYRSRTAPQLAGALGRLRKHVDLTNTAGIEPSLRELLRKVN